MKYIFNYIFKDGTLYSEQWLPSYDKFKSDIVLEEYGLSHIFVLNEGEFTNTFQKFKNPLASTLTKIKSKFGDRPCKILSDIVNKASKHGRKTLYGVLTAITLLSGTLSSSASITPDMEANFSNNLVQMTATVGKAQGLGNQKSDWEGAYKEMSSDFVNLMSMMEDDSKNRYAASGVGCASSEQEAYKLARQEAEKAIKAKYGKNAIQEYGIQFKTIYNKSYDKSFVGGPTIATCYTAIVVAYQSVK